MSAIKESFSLDKFFSMSEAESDKWIKKTLKQREKYLARKDLSKAHKRVIRSALKVALDAARMNKRWAHDRERGAA